MEKYTHECIRVLSLGRLITDLIASFQFALQLAGGRTVVQTSE